MVVVPKYTVRVGKKSYEVTTQQTKKTVWVASGICEGQVIEKKAKTESAALTSWRESAEGRAV